MTRRLPFRVVVAAVVVAALAGCSKDRQGFLCTQDSECDVQHVCQAGACVSPCRRNSQCGPGAACVDRHCVAPSSSSGMVASGSSASASSGPAGSSRASSRPSTSARPSSGGGTSSSATGASSATGPALLLHCPFVDSVTCDGSVAPTYQQGPLRFMGRTSAVELDGHGGVGLDHADELLGTGSFTIEAFIRLLPQVNLAYPHAVPILGANGLSPDGGCVSMGPALLALRYDDAVNPPHFVVSWPGLGSVCSSPTVLDCGALAPSAWQHVAATFNASTRALSCHVQGNRITSSTVPADPVVWGGPLVSRFRGLLDEVRVSGVVRYGASFTPTTSPFVRDGNTVALLHFDEAGGDPRVPGMFPDASGNDHHARHMGVGPVRWATGFIGVDRDVDTGGVFPSATPRGGLAMERKTHNLLDNPGFENNLTGWDQGSSISAFVLSGPWPRFGDKALRLTPSASGANASTYVLSQLITLAMASNVVLSFYAFDDRPTGTRGAPVTADLVVPYLGTGMSNVAYDDVGDGWTRVWATGSMDPSTPTVVGVQLNPAATTPVIVDGFQLETVLNETHPLSSFAESTMGPGYVALTGGVTSRHADQLAYDGARLPQDVGTLCLFFRPLLPYFDPGTMLLPIVQAGSLELGYSPQPTIRYYFLRAPGTPVGFAPPSGGFPESWHFLAARWDTASSTQSITIDDTSASGAFSANVAAGPILLGVDQRQLNGVVSDLRVYDGWLTDAQLAAIAAAR